MIGPAAAAAVACLVSCESTRVETGPGASPPEAEAPEVGDARLDELVSADPAVRSMAAARLSYARDPERKVSTALVRALEDEHADVRKMAAAALGTMKPPATWTIPHLLLAMEDPELLVVSSAAYSLALLGPESRDGLRALVDHESEQTRTYARRALTKIDEDAGE